MNTNNLPQQNDNMDADLYEDAAIKRNRIIRNVGLGGALFGGGLIADAAIRESITPDAEFENNDSDLTEEDILNGADVTENTQVEETTEYVRVEKPVEQQPVQQTPAAEPEQPAEPNIEWEETENLYIDGEKVMSVQSGKIEGHQFTLIDEDADDIADYIGIDVNNDNQITADEITRLTPYDNVRMGHQTAHVSDHHIHTSDPMFADNDNGEQIHNNFEDEKTGENYTGDFAENNQDYNPNSDGGNQYASLNSMESENEIAEVDEMTTSDSYDMAYEESADDTHNLDLDSDEYII